LTRTIALMTGGGDCPGLNAAIRTVVRVAIREYGYRVIGIEDGYEGLIEGRYRELTTNDTRGILRVGGTMLGASNRTNPFVYVGPGLKTARDASEEALATLAAIGADSMVVIGGDGTLYLTQQFASGRFPVVGIPKTIDNDVHGTDYSIGFDTCVTTVTDAIDKVHTTAESHHRVVVIEVMGRTAGWVALFSGVAGGADIVLIPERGYTIDQIMQKIDDRTATGRRFTIIVVAEGVAAPDGEALYISQAGAEHAWKLGGIGNALAASLSQRCEQEVRAIVLGHVQRGGSPTPADRLLATQLAFTAVEALHNGHTGVMAGGQGNNAVLVPFEQVAIGPRLVHDDHPVLSAAESMGVYVG
jgi:ATP-dependent phosphofructokinase / diphosphate-dependent phosphofructokinase